MTETAESRPANTLANYDSTRPPRSPLDWAMGPWARGIIGLGLIGLGIADRVGQIIPGDSVASLSLILGGMMLVGSAFIPGWRMALFALPAAGVIILGKGLGLPEIDGLPKNIVAVVIACLLLGLGTIASKNAKKL